MKRAVQRTLWWLLSLTAAGGCGSSVFGPAMEAEACVEPPANSCERFFARRELGDLSAGLMLDALPADASCRAEVEATRTRFRADRRAALAFMPVYGGCDHFADAVARHATLFPEDEERMSGLACEPGLGLTDGELAAFVGDPGTLERLESIQPRGESPSPDTVGQGPERVSGNTVVLPSTAAAARMRQAGQSRLRASVKLCLDRTGKVTSSSVIGSSGSVCYDRQARDRGLEWTYRPVQLEGEAVEAVEAVEACTAVTFEYRE